MPVIAPLAAGAAKALPHILNAAAFIPLILEFFKGNGADEEAAEKLKQARDGMAARIAAAEGISLAKAQAMVDAELKPLIEQHAKDAGSNAGGVVAGLAAAAGGVGIGRALAKRGAGAVAKGAASAEAAAAPSVAAASADSVVPAGQASAKQASAIEGIRAHGRLDSEIMASRKQGQPVISGKQEKALAGVVDENRMTRQFDPNAEVPSARQAEAADDVGMRGRFEREEPDFVPSLDQDAAVSDIGMGQRGANTLAREAGGMAEMDDVVNQFRVQEAIRRLLELNGNKGFRTPGGMI